MRPELPAWLERVEDVTLPNGLKVRLLDDPQGEVVTASLWYRAGASADDSQYVGTAHFLEHMMFKGTRRFGPGEIDALTQRLGGSNNAFTSHDATAYYFRFAADHLGRALEIEADRMVGLRLDPIEVEHEREVIQEELRQAQAEPWDALEQAVWAELYDPHPYGRSILGSRESLERIDGDVLRDFQAQHYRPGNAILSLAGRLPGHLLSELKGRFDFEMEPAAGMARAATPRRGSPRRVRLSLGETPRLLMAYLVPTDDVDTRVALRAVAAVLALGRASRLHRRFVEEERLALWLSVGLSDHCGPAALSIAAEVVPGEEPLRVEAEILAAVRELGEEPITESELARARRVLLADWLFAHERVGDRGLTLGAEMALREPGSVRRSLERLQELAPADLHEVFERYLAGEPDVIGHTSSDPTE